jgi:very-short-patch-repair endonuclease
MGVRRARQLRKRLTDAERRLWGRLRRKQVDGLRFRHQVPLGPYVVDFLCFEYRLIVEVDGGQHAREPESDARRTAWLEEQGFRVIRFWNNDVLANTDGVVLAIQMALKELPKLSPEP